MRVNEANLPASTFTSEFDALSGIALARALGATAEVKPKAAGLLTGIGCFGRKATRRGSIVGGET